MRLYHESKGIAIDIDVIGGGGAEPMYARASFAGGDDIFYIPQFLGATKGEVLIKVACWAGSEGFSLHRPTCFHKSQSPKFARLVGSR